MKKNNQVLIGVGILVVLLYVYRDKIFGKKSTLEAPNTIKDISNQPLREVTNVAIPSKSKQTQGEIECGRIYDSLPKPAVVQTKEYWAKQKENYIKQCVINRDRQK